MLNFSNIRVITKVYQNKESGLPVGITMRKRKYCPQLSEGGANRLLGRFDTLEEAERVYLKARIERDSKYIQEALKAVGDMKQRLNKLTDSEKVAA